MRGLLIYAILFAGGFLIGRYSAMPERPERIMQVLTRHDTVRIVEAVPASTRQLPAVTKRLAVAADKDTATALPDCVEVQVPMQQRVYTDSRYRAVVSGYMPRLDSLVFVGTTSTKIVSTKKAPRFSVGIVGGYGITPRGFQPFIGVGVSVNIASF